MADLQQARSEVKAITDAIHGSLYFAVGIASTNAHR